MVSEPHDDDQATKAQHSAAPEQSLTVTCVTCRLRLLHQQSDHPSLARQWPSTRKPVPACARGRSAVWMSSPLQGPSKAFGQQACIRFVHQLPERSMTHASPYAPRIRQPSHAKCDIQGRSDQADATDFALAQCLRTSARRNASSRAPWFFHCWSGGPGSIRIMRRQIMCTQLGSNSAYAWTRSAGCTSPWVWEGRGERKGCVIHGQGNVGCSGLERVEEPGLSVATPPRALHGGARLASFGTLYSPLLSSLPLFPPFKPNTSACSPRVRVLILFTCASSPVLAPRKSLRLSATCPAHTTTLSQQATSSESVMPMI